MRVINSGIDTRFKWRINLRKLIYATHLYFGLFKIIFTDIEEINTTLARQFSNLKPKWSSLIRKSFSLFITTKLQEPA